MRISFLGGCREIGRSAFMVANENKKILFDYGVAMNDEIGFPMHIQSKDIQAIFLSHAHLDHSGLLPVFYISKRTKLYGVEPTLELMRLLIKDFINLSGYYLPFEFIELDNMMNNVVRVNFRQKIDLKNGSVTLLDAGHIPGSVQVLLEIDGKRILYTGDFNLTATNLLNAADRNYGDLDAVIMESTYATEDHPPRNKLEEDFIKETIEIVDDGGSVLVPAFGVGRSHEILLSLIAHGFNYPIFLDGMAIRTMRILANYKESLCNSEVFDRSFKEVEFVKNRRHRKQVLKTPSVIIAPAGMLKGGTAVFYMESLAFNKKNAVFLVSYQIPGTPGSILLEKGKFPIKGRLKKVMAKIKKFDFSSHAGMSELHAFLADLSSNPKIFTVHGEEKNCKQLADYACKELGLMAESPKPGDIYDIP